MFPPVSHGVVFGERERCSHNMRLIIPGKSNICLICQCNKIDDLLVTEFSGNRNRLSAGSIEEIIHRFKVMNTVLDVPIEEKYVDILLCPVLRTSLGLLKLHHDGVGAVVAQALEKIRMKVSLCKLENFLEDLSAQILERISFGNLECLWVLLQRKECLDSFLKNYGPSVLPRLLEALDVHVPNIIKCPFAGINAAMLVVLPPSTSLLEINKGVINESQTSFSSSNSQTGAGAASSTFLTQTTSEGSSSGKESLKIVEKLFDVLEASCPTTEGAVLVVTDIERGESQLFSSLPSSEEHAFAIFSPHLKNIMSTCLKLLNSNEIVKITSLSTKILSFLDKLFHHAGALRALFPGPGVTATATAAPFFSMIKKLLFTHSAELKIAALCLVKRMMSAYKHAMEESFADKGNVAHFPDIISQVDLIHFIMETMNTSCENLFRTAVDVLNLMNEIPMFRDGRMIPVLETTLRISKMNIPNNFTAPSTYTALNKLMLSVLMSIGSGRIPFGIQFQLICVFECLPKDWTAQQSLSWIRLLLFCRDAKLEEKLWTIFLAFVQRSRNLGTHYLMPLKCVLLIAHALMKCEVPVPDSANVCSAVMLLQSQSTIFLEPKEVNPGAREASAKKLMHYLMEPNFLPSILALVSYGTADDCMYVTTLLELLKDFPVEALSARSTYSFGPPEFEIVRITYDSENGDEQMTKNRQDPDPVYEIKIERDCTVRVLMQNGLWCWSSKLYMQILGEIRLNLGLMTSQQLFDLWNENVARILSICYPAYIPQLRETLQHSDNNHEYSSVSQQRDNVTQSQSESDQCIIRRILANLDIESTNWAKNFGSGIFSSRGVNQDEKEKHDVISAFYFFYALFVGNDLMKFLDADFAERYSSFLVGCTKQHDMTQCESEGLIDLDWSSLSFYFRTALMITSAFPTELENTFSDAFENLLCEVPEANSNFGDDVMVYHSSVFASLLKWKMYVSFVSLVESWIERDRASCVAFFTDGNFDDQVNHEISNCLISMASKGNRETSALAVAVASKRLKKFKVFFDFTVVKSNFHELMRQIHFDDEDIRMNDESSEDLLLFRLSNLIQIVIEDRYLTSEENFNLEFLQSLLRIMLKFQNAKCLIGRRCLQLLIKILRNENTFQNANAYLVSHRALIEFLGSRLVIKDMDGDVKESIHSYKLLTMLITSNLENFASCSSHEPWVTFKLNATLGYALDIPRLEILEFLIAIFKTNFTCPLIKAEELNEPDEFAKAIPIFMVYLGGLVQKVTVKEFKTAVWELMCEFLRLASSQVFESPNFAGDVLFQPWTKMSISFVLHECRNIPSRASLMFLEFLKRWTSMLLSNKLENPSKRTSLEQTFIFQTYVPLLKKIKDCMENDPTQRPVKGTQQNKVAAERELELTMKDARPDFLDIQKKAEVISVIAETCDTILASFEATKNI